MYNPSPNSKQSSQNNQGNQGNQSEQRIRLLVVDDHAIVREGIQMLLEDETSVDVVGEAANGFEAIALCQSLKPDVVLMDMMMPNMNGLEATQQIKLEQPSVNVLVLTGSFGDDLNVKAALQAGAVGYLLKDMLKADLVHAIKRAASGKSTLHPEAQEKLLSETIARPEPPRHERLTGRESDVLQLLAQGLSNKKIAASLNLTEGTVKGYVSIVLSKLAVHDRTQAALYAVKHGLLG